LIGELPIYGRAANDDELPGGRAELLLDKAITEPTAIPAPASKPSLISSER
jgi:hypothetical protein